MKKFFVVLSAISVLGLAFSSVTMAAPSFHLYVSTAGSDIKPCTRAEPCRTFQVAIDHVTSGGEVVALDSGEFGPVIISKSVTLSGEGVHATITQETAGADAITLKTLSTMTVTLRALTILGVGTAGQGITLNNYVSSGNQIRPYSVAALYVEDCVIDGFTKQGIVFAPVPLGQLFVSDSSIRNCALYGLVVVGGQTTLSAQASIERTRLEHNGAAGLITTAGVSQTTIGNSVLSGNGMGVSTGGLPSEVNINNCLIANNGTGIYNYGITRVANSTITNNKTGLFNAPPLGNLVGKLLSRTTGTNVLTNTVAGNDTNGSFSDTYAAK